MAFTITGSKTTIKVLNQTTVQKVIEVNVETIPEGIQFVYDFPWESWIGAGGSAALEAVVAPVAADVQAIAAQGSVSGVYYAQDTAPNGLLVGYIEAIVSVPPKDLANGTALTATVDIPIAVLGNPEFAAFTWRGLIDDAVARLQALP